MASPALKAESAENPSENIDDSEEEETGEDDHSSYYDDDVSSDDSSCAKLDEENENATKAGSETRTPRPSRFQAICQFRGDQEGDLHFEKGDILTISNTREDGWWDAVDAKGKRGLVPSTFLRPLPESRSSDTTQTATTGPPQRSGQSGSVWKQLSRAISKPSSLDVLAALGALPPGCVPSTLGPLCANADSRYGLRSALAPKLSTSGLAFADLFWDTTNNQVGGRSCRVQRMLSVISCANMPELGGGGGDNAAEVMGRHIRLCLVDGLTVLSNIHTLPVKCDPKSAKSWTVSTQSSAGVTSLLSSTFFVRSSTVATNVGILMELCVSYRKLKAEESNEISLGWAHLPLFTETGLPIANRTLKLNVSMGSPFEKSTVDLSPASAALKGVHPLRAMIRNRQKPVIVVKIGTPSKSTKSQLDMLADNLVAASGWLPYLVFHRQILAEVVLCHRMPSNSAALIHSPFLTAFPSIMEQPDLIDIMHVAWTEKLKAERRNLKDWQAQKTAFHQLFMESVYVLGQLADLPGYSLEAGEARQRVRREALERCVSEIRAQKSALSILLSAQHSHRAFDISELGLDLLRIDCLSHCLPMNHN